MVKHTPGPWIVQKNDRLEISTLGNNCKMIAHVYRSGKAFGATYHNPAWANACLIALAPELLDAVKLLMHALEPDATTEAINAGFEAGEEVLSKLEALS